MGRLALILAAYLDSRHPPIVITRVFARTVYHQILFLIYQALTMKLPHLEIGCKLDSISWTGFFAETAEDTTREVDTEELRITPSGFILGCLQRDAIDRARHRAKVARYTALASVGIARQNDPAPVAWREVRLLLRILNRNPLMKGMEKNQPDGPEYADHLLPHISTAAPVTSMLAKARGNITFQPQDMT